MINGKLDAVEKERSGRYCPKVRGKEITVEGRKRKLRRRSEENEWSI
jgi:hypothetical protein